MDFDKSILQPLINRFKDEFIIECRHILEKIPKRTSETGLDAHFIDLHLAIETCLDNYIITFMGPKLDLKKLGLQYEQKIILSRGIMYLLNIDCLYEGLIMINRIRNQMAHNLGRVLKNDDIEQVWNKFELERFTKKAISGTVNGKSINEFSSLEKIIFLKYIIPLGIKLYTSMWKEWEYIKKNYIEDEQIFEIIKTKMERDFKNLK